MLSTNSLSAFSSATTTTSGLSRSNNNVRLVREPVQASQQVTAPSMKNAMPNQMPNIAPPRGTFLNLSV